MGNNIVDTDRAYILGLILGGGEIIGNRLVITLPYRNWGSLSINPERGGEISGYIMNTLKPIWRHAYGIDVSYTVTRESWEIFCEVNEALKNDLISLQLPSAGKIKETANISTLCEKLDNQEKIKRFIAGLTDTIGSLAKSHRHRVAKNQIISFEFSGKNFNLITSLVGLFSKINCYPDQILWNHPNFHSGANRYYKSWKKGFKLRIRLYDYMLKGNFVSEAKRLSAEENALLQNTGEKTMADTLSINGRTTLHMDENSEWLPSNIRGLHFIHYTHLLYILGGAVSKEMLDFLQKKLETPETLITPFTMLTKGTKQEIQEIIKNEPYLRESKYREVSITDFNLAINSRDTSMVYGVDEYRGFPKNHIMHAITYVVLAQMGSDKIFGTRISGKFEEEFETIKDKISSIGVKILKPDRGTCLIVETKDYAALVGYVDDEFNKKLVSVDKNTLKMRIKNPTYLDCFPL